MDPVAIETSNPWPALPLTGEFVLREDREAVLKFNNDPKTGTHHRLRLEFLPEPFSGRTNAPVVLLSCNPCVAENASVPTPETELHNLIMASLRHEPLEHPFYHLKGCEAECQRTGGDFYETKKFRGNCDVMLSESVFMFRVLAGRRRNTRIYETASLKSITLDGSGPAKLVRQKVNLSCIHRVKEVVERATQLFKSQNPPQVFSPAKFAI